jgi:L-fucose mutarotase/ribose pyranase (RbsD/FucU family)
MFTVMSNFIIFPRVVSRFYDSDLLNHIAAFVESLQGFCICIVLITSKQFYKRSIKSYTRLSNGEVVGAEP